MGLKELAANSTVAAAERASGRQAFGLLWSASRALAAVVVGWVVLSSVLPTLVVIALGLVVAAVPGAVEHGIGGRPPADHGADRRRRGLRGVADPSARRGRGLGRRGALGGRWAGHARMGTAVIIG